MLLDVAFFSIRQLLATIAQCLNPEAVAAEDVDNRAETPDAVPLRPIAPGGMRPGQRRSRLNAAQCGGCAALTRRSRPAEDRGSSSGDPCGAAFTQCWVSGGRPGSASAPGETG